MEVTSADSRLVILHCPSHYRPFYFNTLELLRKQLLDYSIRVILSRYRDRIYLIGYSLESFFLSLVITSNLLTISFTYLVNSF